MQTKERERRIWRVLFPFLMIILFSFIRFFDCIHIYINTHITLNIIHSNSNKSSNNDNNGNGDEFHFCL